MPSPTTTVSTATNSTPGTSRRRESRWVPPPGGAQDIGHFRDLVDRGQVPPEASVTPEGLFGEHDLPLPEAGCERLLCAVTAAMPARLTAAPEVDWLGQVGFTSGIDPAAFRRPPLNLVAVVDQSCSMSDDPITTVRASLTEVVRQLGPADQLSIVLYGSGVTTHLAPTRDPAAMRASIASIPIAGATNMEAGLQHGFELARQTRRTFDGTTRVMLFTDEQPNVGNTHADGFMGLAERASLDGIGMTTIGVGTGFGSELATRVSSVRGGNLYFVADPASMKETFVEDFDTMVTELAYDLRLRIEPAPGVRVVDVYGLPGELLQRRADGSVEVEVKTLFLSRDRGAIYVGFDAEGDGARLQSPGSVTLACTARDGEVAPSRRSFDRVNGPSPRGLTRGELLVDEALALKAAARSHQLGEHAAARSAIQAVSARFRATGDGDLGKELKLLEALERTLAGEVRVEPVSADGGEFEGMPLLVTGG